MANYFASTFDPSNFGPNLFAQNPLLMATFGVILALTVINIAYGCRFDRRDNAGGWTTLETAKARRALGRERELGALRKDAGIEESEEVRRAIADGETVTQIARESLPEFVHEISLCRTFRTALIEDHSIISSSALGPYDPVLPRYIRAQVGRGGGWS